MVEDFDSMDETPMGPSHPPGLDNGDEVGRTYTTTSQVANEKILLTQNWRREG
jgi:hypothetical protein